MDELFDQIKGISEDNQAFVWDKIYDVNYSHLKQPKDYLLEQSAAIRLQFNQIWVWKVHYWN